MWLGTSPGYEMCVTIPDLHIRTPNLRGLLTLQIPVS